MVELGQIGPVILVFALLAATLWLLKRRGLAQFSMAGRNRSLSRKQTEVLERISLTPQHSLHLVRVADRVMLIGVSPSSCSLLTDSVQLQAPVEGGIR